MKTLIDKEITRLVKKMHVLYGRLGMNDNDRLAFLSAWGVEHTNDLTAQQLLEAIGKLDALLNPASAEMDKWRKRVMASIGGWLRACGITHDAKYIRGIAEHAAGMKRFNEIPVAELRRVYYEFKRKQQTHNRVDEVTAEAELFAIHLN